MTRIYQISIDIMPLPLTNVNSTKLVDNIPIKTPTYTFQKICSRRYTRFPLKKVSLTPIWMKKSPPFLLKKISAAKTLKTNVLTHKTYIIYYNKFSNS